MTKTNIFFVFLLIIAAQLACGLPGGNIENEQPSKTQTAPIPIPKSTSTVEPSSNPTSTSTAGQSVDSATINHSNVSQLVVSTPLDLPEMPQRILFPPDSLVIPSDQFPHPDLLLQNGPSYYPVMVDGPELGEMVPLPLNGNEILAFAPDATSLVVRDPVQTGVYTIDGKSLWTISKPEQPYGVSYSSDGNILAVTSPNEWSVTLYDTSNWE